MDAAGTAANHAAATATSCADANNLKLTFALHEGDSGNIVAGDTFKFCDNGGVFRDQLDVLVSGTSGNEITYEAASGETPLIYGSEEKNDAGDWTQEIGVTTDWESDFEGNDFSEWTSETDPNSDLATSSTQKKTGSYSAHWLMTAGVDTYLVKDLSSQVADATFTFYIFPIVDGPMTTYVWNSSIDGCFNLVWGSAGGEVTVRLDMKNDAGGTHNTSAYQIGADSTWHKIQVIVVTDGSNGSGELLIDDVSKETESGFDNSDRGNIYRIRFGSDVNTAEFYIDDVTVTHAAATNLWYWATGTEPNVAWRDIGSGFSRMTKVAKGSCDADGKWAYDSGKVYVYDSTGEPTRTGARDFEFPQRDHSITATDKDYITIDGLSLKYCNSDIVEITYSASDLTNWTIQNSTISGCWVHGIAFQGASGHNSDVIILSSNTIDDWGGTAAGGQGAGGIWLEYIDNFEISINTISGNVNAPVGYGYHRAIFVGHTSANDENSKINENSFAGTVTGANAGVLTMADADCIDIYENRFNSNAEVDIWFDESGTDTNDGPTYCNVYFNDITSGANADYVMHIERSSNNNFHHNIFDMRDATAGNKVVWFARNSQGNTLYNNTLLFDDGVQAVQLGWASDPAGNTQINTKVKNNIFYRTSGTTGATIVLGENGGPTTTGIDFDNNLYFDPDYADIINWFETKYASVDAWTTGQSQESDHVEGDPPIHQRCWRRLYAEIRESVQECRDSAEWV
jgi:hypothetical protein